MAVAKFGHNLLAILKHADEVAQCNDRDFQDQLTYGIFLNNGTKKYILDEEKNGNRFFVYARALKIAKSEDPRYWKWIYIAGSFCVRSIEAAELLKVTWLDIRGMIEASILSPKMLYQVVFDVMMRKCGSGWEVPVTIELKLPNGSIIEQRKEDLRKLPIEKWVEISVATFTLSESEIRGCGHFEFSLYEHGNHSKSGLVVKSVDIRPIARELYYES